MSSPMPHPDSSIKIEQPVEEQITKPLDLASNFNNIDLNQNKKETETTQSKDNTETEAASTSAWSLTSLWGSAAKAINEKTSSNYLPTELSSVTNKINELSTSIKQDPSKTLNSTFNSLGSGLKNLTKDSMSSVLTSMKQEDESIRQLNLHLLTDLPFKPIEAEARLAWSGLGEQADDSKYHQIKVSDGNKLLSEGPNALSVETLDLLARVAPGLVEGYEVAKYKVEAAYSALPPKEEETHETPNTLFAQIQTSLMLPIQTSDGFISLHPVLLPSLPEQQWQLCFCCLIYEPSFENPLSYTLSQALPHSLAISLFGQDPLAPEVDEKYGPSSLDADQMAHLYAIIQMCLITAFQQLITPPLNSV